MTDMYDFASPSIATGVDLASLKGSLLIFEVLGIEEHVPTIHTQAGEKTPAVRANVLVLDGPHVGEDNTDVLIFPKMLQGQLKASVGRMVLGRLGQAPAQQGKNPAWKLDLATEADSRAASTFMSNRKASPAGASTGPAMPEPPF